MEGVTSIAFVGSRATNEAMLRYTERAVNRAIEKRWLILIGDNPQGIDRHVAEVCVKAGYPKVGIVSVEGERRLQRAMAGENVKSRYSARQYRSRDREMIGWAQVVMCIWNGTSQGTYAAWEYAKTCKGKEAYLVQFTGAKYAAQGLTVKPEARAR